MFSKMNDDAERTLRVRVCCGGLCGPPARLRLLRFVLFSRGGGRWTLRCSSAPHSQALQANFSGFVMPPGVLFAPPQNATYATYYVNERAIAEDGGWDGGPCMSNATSTAGQTVCLGQYQCSADVCGSLANCTVYGSHTIITRHALMAAQASVGATQCVLGEQHSHARGVCCA